MLAKTSHTKIGMETSFEANYFLGCFNSSNSLMVTGEQAFVFSRSMVYSMQGQVVGRTNEGMSISNYIIYYQH